MEKFINSIASPEPQYQKQTMRAICKFFWGKLTNEDPEQTKEDYQRETQNIRFSRELDKLRKY